MTTDLFESSEYNLDRPDLEHELNDQLKKAYSLKESFWSLVSFEEITIDLFESSESNLDRTDLLQELKEQLKKPLLKSVAGVLPL